VNRLVITILLFPFLLSSLLPQALKDDFELIPELIQHYHEHLRSDPATTITKFLRLHYGQGYAQHRAAHEHDKLPFKCGDHKHEALSASVFALEPIPCAIPSFQWPSPVCRRSTFPDVALFFSAPVFDIWQPPKCMRTA